MNEFTETGYAYILDAMTLHDIDTLRALAVNLTFSAGRVGHAQLFNPSHRKSVVAFLDTNCTWSNWAFGVIRAEHGVCNTPLEKCLGIQLALYRTGDFYDWHVDADRVHQDGRKVTLVVQLSDENDYEGGELQVKLRSPYDRTISAPSVAGTAVIFGSELMHRVTLVKKGQRCSLTCWFG
ncbi:PKHD-type hydroxylase [Pseudomonas reinekei]|uniref:2OG-Fe(II) oxygenase n=1 Tax=Pseudomonas reinekei TaxID=395598 RepID=A0A1H0T0P9_PSERE|nr:2OG-Fe(II) oxygenase [Pseudomonas reinekei]KAB0482026.1 2OG-Fe(II) oxygenase [Pseudomonas reinekei]OLT99954.1 hypothetical protein BVK86_23910 [Pseudomonas reinekei]SDP47623.1 PKHD-type hydroxylase [Pseudomonas reinekei]